MVQRLIARRVEQSYRFTSHFRGSLLGKQRLSDTRSLSSPYPSLSSNHLTWRSACVRLISRTAGDAEWRYVEPIISGYRVRVSCPDIVSGYRVRVSCPNRDNGSLTLTATWVQRHMRLNTTTPQHKDAPALARACCIFSGQLVRSMVQ